MELSVKKLRRLIAEVVRPAAKLRALQRVSDALHDAREQMIDDDENHKRLGEANAIIMRVIEDIYAGEYGSW